MNAAEDSERSISLGEGRSFVNRIRGWAGLDPEIVDQGESSQEMAKEKPAIDSSASNGKASVELGAEAKEIKASKLPESLRLEELLHLNELKVRDHLLSSNTFFHGKVGFYETIIRRIYEAAEDPEGDYDFSEEINYIYTWRRLPKSRIPDRLILLPREKSQSNLNDFVSKALLHDSNVPVWLIANPLAVQHHLLLGFSNFFIASDSEEEIRHLRNVLSLPEKTAKWLLAAKRREAVFITNYKHAVERTDSLLAIVYLLDL